MSNQIKNISLEAVAEQWVNLIFSQIETHKKNVNKSIKNTSELSESYKQLTFTKK